MNFLRALVVGFMLLGCAPAFGQGERVWLTHRSNDPTKIVINWTTASPTESVVRFGNTKELGHEARVDGMRTLHHVEIPVVRDTTCHYSAGGVAGSFKSWPADELRVAVVANWHSKADLSAILKDDVHFLMTAGDNISSLWQRCGAGNKNCVTSYAELIDAYPELFRSTPFMPVLGNHDREIRPRGPRPPAEPVYDVDATAFRTFFELPDDEWKWHFDLPGFGVRFIALDFNHISDFGTTWQSCHEFGEDSAQFQWYKKLASDAPEFVVTLYNERNSAMRGQGWQPLFQQGTACISGFGHFGERAEVDGALYFNTSLTGTGSKYPDSQSKVLHSEDNYLLLTFTTTTMAVEMKNLAGKVLDRTEIKANKAGK